MSRCSDTEREVLFPPRRSEFEVTRQIHQGGFLYVWLREL